MTKTRPKRKTRRPSWIRLDRQALGDVRKALHWSSALADAHLDGEGIQMIAALVRARCDLAIGRLEQSEREGSRSC
jgi:hypothetical protein